jgi:hypothetical protein
MDRENTMKTAYVNVPTYDPECDEEYDYARLHTVAIQRADGVRVIMGDPKDDLAPDVLIERAVDLWRVVVHPDAGDPLCMIEIRRYRAAIEDEWGQIILEQDLG